VGLAGEIRGVTQATSRVIEGRRLGFERAVVPADNARGVEAPEGLTVVPVANLKEALDEAGVF
jgi:DNA repair protein RadA/Sms